jgi:hypothetical protein
MGLLKCRRPGVRGLYVRIANVALLFSVVGGGAKPVAANIGDASEFTGSTVVVAYVREIFCRIERYLQAAVCWDCRSSNLGCNMVGTRLD